MKLAAMVICGSFIIEGTTMLTAFQSGAVYSLLYLFQCFPFLQRVFLLGASLIVAVQAVKKGAAQEGMKLRDYIWRGHDPTSVAVMTEVVTYCT